jgi:hypothetical protein
MREEHRLTLRCLLHWNLAFAISIAPRRVYCVGKTSGISPSNA